MPKKSETDPTTEYVQISPGMKIKYSPGKVFYDVITDAGEPEIDDYTMPPETVSALRALEKIHGHGIIPENNETRKRVK